MSVWTHECLFYTLDYNLILFIFNYLFFAPHIVSVLSFGSSFGLLCTFFIPLSFYVFPRTSLFSDTTRWFSAGRTKKYMCIYYIVINLVSTIHHHLHNCSSLVYMHNGFRIVKLWPVFLRICNHFHVVVHYSKCVPLKEFMPL